MSTNRSTIPGPFRRSPAAEKPKGILDFIEHPLTLTALFALGGLVGTLIYTPFYVLCAIGLLLGLHRSGYVSARAVRVQVRIYLIAVVVLCVGGYFLYGLLEAAVQRIQDDFAKKVADLVREKPSKVPETTDVQKKEPPVETRPSELPKPPKPEVTPKKNPLEITALNSTQNMSLANNGPLSVYVMDILMSVSEPRESKSVQLGFDIGPGKIHEYKFQADPSDIQHFKAIKDLGKTWEEHYQRAGELYRACGMELAYFSQADTRFQQIASHYSRQCRSLIYTDALSVIRYRVAGLPDTKSQTIPVVAITIVDQKCP
jgi:hypothetical protein